MFSESYLFVIISEILSVILFCESGVADYVVILFPLFFINREGNVFLVFCPNSWFFVQISAHFSKYFRFMIVN